MSDNGESSRGVNLDEMTPDTVRLAGSGIVSAKDAAGMLGLNERTVRRAIARGDLLAVKRGRSFQITLESLAHFLQQRAAGAARGSSRSPPADPPGNEVKTIAGAPLGSGRDRLVVLPSPVTRFVGRERDVAAAAELLLREGTRLVTLIGPGGVGKTRLALRMAEEIAGEFGDGAVFVPLAAVRDVDLVLPALVQALGLREGEGQPAQARLTSFLCEREMLLILDNLEHVTGVGPALFDLLTGCPKLTVLVTSRTPLHVSGERHFPVPPLALPGRGATPGEETRPATLAAMAEIEAIALFIDRAQATDASFVLDTENAPLVAAICERTDGLPLAIELAAARTSVLSLPDLLERLSHRLTILRGGPREQLPRLRSMADAIGWSYDLLAADERALFRHLAVFVGGVTLGAAASVSGGAHDVGGDEGDSVLDGLTALVDQSLLQRVAGPGGTTRYTMLETVREYGLERLAESGDEPAVRSAHADWCLALAEQADAEVSGPHQAAWFERLEAEHPNLRGALSWLLERGDAGRGVRLATALSWFWSSRGYLREALGWFDAFLALPVEIALKTRAILIQQAANIAQWQSDLDRAADLAAEALDLVREHGDPLYVAWSLRGLGSIAIDRGHLDQAASFLTESWELLQTLGTPWDAAFVIYLWGRHAAAGNQFAEAAERFTNAAAAFREAGDRAYVAAALGRLGAASLSLMDYAAARTAYRESLRLARELREQSRVAWALTGAAHLAVVARQPDTAARLLGAAMAIRETIGEGEHGDDLAPEMRAILMGQRFAAARAQGMTTPGAEVIAEAFAILDHGDDAQRRHRAAAMGAEALTPRERDVLRLLVDGLSDKEIGAALGITRVTVSNHVTAIRDKLAVPSRTAAAALAVRDGLV